MKRMFFVFLVLSIITPGSAQSPWGVDVGDSPSVLDTIELEPLLREGYGAIKMAKYRSVNGNELSVTYNSYAGRIIFIEYDWSLSLDGTATGLPLFIFGVTTLEDIRNINGSNGFSWKSRAMNSVGDMLVTFNAYEIKGRPGVIAIFVTNAHAGAMKKEWADLSQAGTSFKLHALILAEESYLDELWGKEKVYDKDYKSIFWDKYLPIIAASNVDSEPIDPSDYIPLEIQPVPITQVGPDYPETARRAGVEGTVWVKILVDKEGKAKKAVIMKSDNEIFDEAAHKAAMGWVFTPAMMNNGPVAVWVAIPFRFKLNQKQD